MKREQLDITILDGRSSKALLVAADDGPRPGLIVIHEWWGVNEDIVEHAERFAAEGFASLVIDLYFGSSTGESEVAKRLSDEMKTSVSMEIVGAAVEALKTRTNGQVGVTGFCMGGGMSLCAACTVPGIGAAVPFYGIGRDEFIRFTKDTPPVQGHYANVDRFIDPERVRKIREKALAAGASFELFFYDAGHAFMRRKDPKVFDAASAETAWRRAVAFLHAHLDR